MKKEINTTNKFLVGAKAGDIAILAFNRILSKEDALLLAAYLVCLADDGSTEFEFGDVLCAVQST